MNKILLGLYWKLICMVIRLRGLMLLFAICPIRSFKIKLKNRIETEVALTKIQLLVFALGMELNKTSIFDIVIKLF